MPTLIVFILNVDDRIPQGLAGFGTLGVGLILLYVAGVAGDQDDNMDSIGIVAGGTIFWHIWYIIAIGITAFSDVGLLFNLLPELPLETWAIAETVLE